jgi:hypothetical protein
MERRARKSLSKTQLLGTEVNPRSTLQSMARAIFSST